MARKYARDYRLIDSVDERGRIRTDTEYVGACYGYAGGAAAARAALRKMLFCASAAAVCFLLPLLFRSSATLTMYVTLPYLFTALPLWLLLAALRALSMAGETLDHRRADLVNDRLPGASLWLMLLPGASLLGELGALLFARVPFLVGDGVFLVCAAAVLLCGLVCLRLRRGLCAEKLD